MLTDQLPFLSAHYQHSYKSVSAFISDTCRNFG